MLRGAIGGESLWLGTSCMASERSAEKSVRVCDVGRYPSDSDDRAAQLVSDLNEAKWSARIRHDVSRWKYAKLLDNLSNAVQVVLSLEWLRTLLEARALRASRQPASTSRRPPKWGPPGEIARQPADCRPRTARSSTCQRVMRGAGSVESDYLNDEIALLGRIYGVPTPVNVLQHRA